MNDSTRLAIINEINDISARLELEIEPLKMDCHHSTAELIAETVDLLTHLRHSFHTKFMRETRRDLNINRYSKWGNIDDE